MGVGSHERLFFHPPRVTVRESLTPRQMKELVSMDECAVTRIRHLQEMIEDRSMVTLFALADYVRPDDQEKVKRAVVGSLLAPIYVGDHKKDNDIDKGVWDDLKVCEVADLFGSFEDDEKTGDKIVCRLLNELLERREKLRIDAIRCVVPLEDRDMQNALLSLGFMKFHVRENFISMVNSEF